MGRENVMVLHSWQVDSGESLLLEGVSRGVGLS